MAADTITINRQDTYTRTINTKDSDGNLVDATGWTIYFTVRSSVAATSTTTDTNAIISKTITGEATGIHTLLLTSSDTDIDPASYIYDFQIKRADGSINSSDKALFVVDGDVTRST